jgi:uncharacterized protein YbjT (DUF2867 family)
VNILVTGISGYVGSLVAARLARDGHSVRGFARHPERVRMGLPVVAGDAVSGAGLKRAMHGVDVAYYLIHSMEPADGDPFATRERTAAERFVEAAEAAGVQRLVYLGGLVPRGGPASDHLASRLEVEQILLEGSPASVALRASIVIGARSRSFRFLVHLVERLPVLALPGWRDNVTRPIDERDIVEMLVQCGSSDRVTGRSLDVGGPDVVSYGQLIERIRELMLVDRPTVGLGRLTVSPIASRVAALIAGEQYELIGPLMDSLATDLLPRNDEAGELLNVRFHSLDAAIERSLCEWEKTEELAAR